MSRPIMNKQNKGSADKAKRFDDQKYDDPYKMGLKPFTNKELDRRRASLFSKRGRKKLSLIHI